MAGKKGFTKKLNTTPQLYKDQTGIIPVANGQYCVSSGNKSLDQILGGGLPVGTLLVMYEDS